MMFVVYATRSRIIRRIIVADPGMRLEDHVGHGEDGIELSAQEEAAILPRGALGPDLSKIGDHIQARTGLRPLDPRCAVVDADGNVVNVVNADPDLDAIPGYDLIRDSEAGPGWKRRGGAWEKPPEPEPLPAEIADQQADEKAPDPKATREG